jgi:putative sigma-54 modulation protein
MRLELTGRHVTITPGVRKTVDECLAHCLRTLNDSAVSAQVVLTKEKSRLHAEVTVHARGEKFLHGEAAGRDLALALGAACDKIDQQARKIKGKWRERKRRGVSAAKAGSAAPQPQRAARAFAGDLEEPRELARAPRIVRMRRYAVKPMTIEDAAAEIGDGHDAVIVFRNSSSDVVTVLFRRPDGNLGLIEPEA